MTTTNESIESRGKACSCCAPAAGNPEATGDAAGSGELVGGVQEARITVAGGYSPAAIRLARGIPTRLVFERNEASRCSEELLIPAFGVQQSLPQGEPITVEFTPTEIGTFAFTCGMRMLRGEIVVS